MPIATPRSFAVVALLIFVPAASAFAQLEVAPTFGDHMVIQRAQPIIVWGKAAPDASLTVTIGDKKASAKADSAGQWTATLDPLPASGPLDMTVSTGAESRAIQDVMIGDVWLLSGQSNMVLALQATTNWPVEKTAGEFPSIRICKVPGDGALDPAETFSRALRWEPLNSAKAGFFSGVGYYFARTVQPAIGVTLGLIQSSAGGTQAEQWTPEAQLRAALPDNPLFEVREKMKAKRAADPAAKIGVMEGGAASLYNGSIHPLRHQKFTGVLWYQGEANSRSPRDYRPVLKTLVSAWREVFAEPDLPFVIVQLPKFGLPKDDGWMRVQEAQMLAAHDLGLPLAVTIDEGSATTIHPPNKAEVGRRAALAALQHVYHQNVDGTSPAPKSVKFMGGSAVAEFDGFQGDLVVKGDALPGFELAGADHLFHPATAELKGRVVTVKSADVPSPQAIRYLWANSPEVVALYSAAGLPAGPFRAAIDDGQKPWTIEPSVTTK